MAKTLRQRSEPNGIAADELQIERGIAYTGKITREGKYDALFAKIRSGDSIRCEVHEAGALRNAALAAVRKPEKFPHLAGMEVRARSKWVCPKTGQVFGRVWFLHPQG